MESSAAEKWWFGPDEKFLNEGFDDLFRISQDYQIPSPSIEQKKQVEILKFETARVVEEKENEVEMNDIFGNKERNEQESNFGDSAKSFFGFGSSPKVRSTEIPNSPAPSMESIAPAASTLQAVQERTSSVNIVVLEPRSFDDSLEAVNHLKARKSIILNLSYLDNEVSQRVLDFVSGATFAMDGTQERIGTGVFIFASMNCKVETDTEGTKAYKELFAKTFGV